MRILFLVLTLIVFRPVYASTCKQPDFDSWSTARNLKNIILAEKPSLSEPNFNEHFLILKAALSMETLWFLLDCDTGRFEKITLEGSEAHYHLRSSRLELKTKEDLQIQEWKDHTWIRVIPESTKIAQVSSVSTEVQGHCKKPDFDSYHRAAELKDTILKNDPLNTLPNFAGHYVVRKAELLFETLWFAWDCNNGIFIRDFLKGKDATFLPTDGALKILSGGDFPKSYRPARNQWVEIPTSEHPQKRVTNILEGAGARELFKAIPNPENHSQAEIENLFCKAEGTALHCKGNLPGQEKVIELKPEYASQIKAIIDDFGAPVQSPKLLKASCRINLSRCELESGLELL